jgi:ABC-type nickel/cobalt efflux system permease component RcnA
MKDFYNQLVSDTQAYLKTQYQLLQVRSIEQTSQLLGLIITLFAMTAIVVIGLIFLAIALAAWLEQWLPMWASYLVIAGAMLLIALGVFWGRRLWFVRPIEKHLSEVVMDNPQPLKQQKQSLESQSSMQRELLERDLAEVRRDWSQVQQIWQMIRSLLKGGIDKDVR